MIPASVADSMPTSRPSRLDGTGSAAMKAGSSRNGSCRSSRASAMPAIAENLRQRARRERRRLAGEQPVAVVLGEQAVAIRKIQVAEPGKAARPGRRVQLHRRAGQRRRQHLGRVTGAGGLAMPDQDRDAARHRPSHAIVDALQRRVGLVARQ